MTKVLRVLVAHDAATRTGIRVALAAEVEICAEAANAAQAVSAATREQPDVCLIGRELAGDAFEAVRGICRAAPRAAVLVLARDADSDDLIESVRAGAVGYLPGPFDEQGLRRIIRAVAAQEAVRAPGDGA